jgi:hypothetical protein
MSHVSNGRFERMLAAALCTVAVLAAVPVAAAPIPTTRATLANGLNVIIVPTSRLPSRAPAP